MTALPLLLHGLAENIPAVDVAGLALDNRQIKPGMGFVALRGTRQHGLQYAQAAIEAGAVVVLYEPEDGLAVPVLSVPLLAVPDLAQVLGEVAARFYVQPADGLFMVGIMVSIRPTFV